MSGTHRQKALTRPGLPTRGHGLWRQEFYSIHAHMRCTECPTDKHGSWHNVWGQRASQGFYWLAPGLWRWWVNRPGSRARRQMERWFPRLRGREKP
jgi:hypothetical protein